MDEEIKNLLQKNLEVSKESLRVLQKMHKAVVWGRVARLIKWVVVIVLLAVLFVKIQPYWIYWSKVLINISTNMDKFNSFFNR